MESVKTQPRSQSHYRVPAQASRCHSISQEPIPRGCHSLTKLMSRRFHRPGYFYTSVRLLFPTKMEVLVRTSPACQNRRLSFVISPSKMPNLQRKTSRKVGNFTIKARDWLARLP